VLIRTQAGGPGLWDDDIAYEAYAPSWWTLTDPEGNEADIAAWEGRR
jgi:hypothetical protein